MAIERTPSIIQPDAESATKNAVHGSDGPEAACFFPEGVCERDA
jgi:nucleoside diphosphate kinase